ncbi:MAG: hypothetical protein WCP01_14785 [Methylococcaceae bacterium]
MKSSDKPPTILNVLKTAQPVSNNLEVDKFADRRVGKYCISEGRIWLFCEQYIIKDGTPVEKKTALTHNFVALIDEQHNFDDGIQTTTAFSIIAKHKSGRVLSTLTIPATQYNAMQWALKNWGALAISEANAATPRQLANAILILSGDIPIIDIYQHTGWRMIKNEWHYLSGSGAIGANGLDSSIRVDLGFEELADFSLPEPDKDPTIARELFDFLTIAGGNNLAVGVSIFAGNVRSVLGEAYAVDFSLFLAGKTGCGKTEVMALAQSAFCKYRYRILPAGFKDSQTALTIKSHRIKDASLAIDDIKPGASRKQRDEKIEKFNHLVEETGDQNARSRANADMSAQKMVRPRCMPFITGEIIPDGSSSTLGRLLAVEIKRGDINLTTDSSFLTSLQHKAVEGKYSKAMATYIQWLAPRMSELKRTFRKTCQVERDEAKKSPDKFLTGSHARFAESYAQLKCATDLYLEYCLEVGGIKKSDAEGYRATIDKGLQSVIRAQGQFQKDSDEAERAIRLLGAGFKSGEFYVANYLTKGPPTFNPYTWGWRKLAEKEGFAESIAGKGDQIGWIRQAKIKKSELGNIAKDDFDCDVEDETKSELWLIPDAFYKAVQRLANAQGQPLKLGMTDLFRGLIEIRVLVRTEFDKKSKTTRYSTQTPCAVPGFKKPRVLSIYCKTILEESDDDSEWEVVESSNDKAR